MSGAGDVGSAVDRGIRYLEERRSERHWRDFAIAGESDMWTTAWIGGMLAEMEGSAAARALAEDAFGWLQEVEDEGRWSYSGEAPLDADSTIWVSRLAERLGAEVSPRTVDFLKIHLQEDDRVATFRPEAYVERFGDNPVERPGWCTGHLCVTAVAAALESLPWRARLTDALASRQADDGSWDGYWWVDKEYTTSFAMEGLAGDPARGEALEAAADWLETRIDATGAIPTPHYPAGSPYAVALALRGLALVRPGSPAAERAARWLVARQEEDGSWISSAALRLVHPSLVEPDPSRFLPHDGPRTLWNTPILDQHRLHTTSVGINALWHYRRGRSG